MFAWRAFRDGDAPGAGDGSTRPPAPGAFLCVPALAPYGIAAAFTTRHGGVSEAPFASLNLSLRAKDDPPAVRANRMRVLDAIGAPPDAWTCAEQVHGAGVANVGRADRGAGAADAGDAIAGADALWTLEPGIALAVLTADCVPILLADPDRGLIGVVHAGWRGLAAGVVGRAVEEMAPSSPSAFIGPSIGPCCYEVGEDVAAEVASAVGDGVVRRGPGAAMPSLDLWEAAATALRAAGVGAIAAARICTRSEHHRFYSHRAGDDARQGLVVVRR